MSPRGLCLAAAVFALPLPAAAGVVVLGSGNARMCYLAAEAPGVATADDLERCNDAIIEERADLTRLVSTHVNRGILRLRRGDTSGAMRDFDEATRLNPAEPEAYLNRAHVLLRDDQVARAIVQFDSAIERQTRRPALAHYGRAIAYEESGNLRAAYNDYRRASQLAPSWEDPRVELTRFRVVRN